MSDLLAARSQMGMSLAFASGFPEPISPFELAPRALYLTWAILPHYKNTPEALAASSADLFGAIYSRESSRSTQRTSIALIN